MLLREWFWQKSMYFCRHDFTVHALFRQSGHEDGWNVVAVGNQQLLELRTAHARHANVENEARRFKDEPGSKEVLSRPECGGGIAMRSQEGLRCLSDGHIVINDRYHDDSVQSALPPL